MIKSFSVKNYKNFKEEVTLDFSDYRDYKYNEYAIKNNLLNTAIIYGKNSSGKSNFGLALFDITTHLVDKQQNMEQHTFFLNVESVEKVAHFTYEFQFDQDIVKYHYRKLDSTHLAYEEMILNDTKIFSYNFESKQLDKNRMDLINADQLIFNYRDTNISILRFIANNTQQSKHSVVNQLITFVSSMLWFRSLGENNYIGYLKGIELITDNIIQNGLVSKFQDFLQQFDVKCNLDVATDPFGKKFLVSKFKNNKFIPFWETASSGTKSLTLYYYWSHKFKDISFLFIDEYDAFYHTNVAINLVKQIAEQKSPQTIFTTHNTAVMSNQILRPDCYFVLSEGHLTSLPNCTSRELREGHNLEKMFRQGEFI